MLLLAHGYAMTEELVRAAESDYESLITVTVQDGDPARAARLPRNSARPARGSSQRHALHDLGRSALLAGLYFRGDDDGGHGYSKIQRSRRWNGRRVVASDKVRLWTHKLVDWH